MERGIPGNAEVGIGEGEPRHASLMQPIEYPINSLVLVVNVATA
jgi:hypothetical protein